MNRAGKTLYVRNVPDRVLRDAKALAAREGVTLGALVVAALRDKTASVTDATSSLEQDMRWHEERREDLQARYGGEYVAIAQGRVLDHDVDFDALATRVFASNGGGPVYMPRIQAAERLVELRSPRRA